MKTLFPNKKTLILLIIVLVIVLDQVSKIIVRHDVALNSRIAVIDNVVTLTRVENTGAFLSLGEHLSKAAYNGIMIFVPVIVLGYALFYLLKHDYESPAMTIGISLIVSGGAGNLIDRILYGSVTDFLHFNFGLFQTGIVNIADMSITAGFIILFIKMLFLKEKQKTDPAE